MRSIFQAGNRQKPGEPLWGNKGIEHEKIRGAEQDPTLGGIGLTSQVFGRFVVELERLSQTLGFQRALNERSSTHQPDDSEDSDNNS